MGFILIKRGHRRLTSDGDDLGEWLIIRIKSHPHPPRQLRRPILVTMPLHPLLLIRGHIDMMTFHMPVPNERWCDVFDFVDWRKVFFVIWMLNNYCLWWRRRRRMFDEWWRVTIETTQCVVATMTTRCCCGQCVEFAAGCGCLFFHSFLSVYLYWYGRF